MNKIIKNKSGSVLLYSLLIISLITAIAIIISVIVVNEIKLTSASSNGVQAYYAAESGIEKGLYEVKKLRNDSQQTLSDAVSTIELFNSDDFDNNASYNNEGTDSHTSTVVNRYVKENDYVQIDYYDVEDPLSISGVNAIVVSNSGGEDSTWAEVTWTAWDSNGNLGTSTEAKVIIGPTNLLGGWPINNLDVFDSIDPVGYRIRVKALRAIPIPEVDPGYLSALTVIPYDNPPSLGGSEITDLPTQLVIKSVGERNNFKQSLTATVPWNLPLFGLYDYVIYSEGDLLKDIILSSSTYSSGVIEVENDLTSNCDQISCSDCRNNGWLGFDCEDLVQCTVNGTCKFQYDNNLLGYTLPIPDTVPQGDEYYVTVRALYTCGGATIDNCDNRDLAVEINGQSSIIDDQATEQIYAGSDVENWKTCTLTDTFSLGDPTLGIEDPSRTVKFSPHQGNWNGGEWVSIDWYQLSTYKIFPDCE